MRHIILLVTIATLLSCGQSDNKQKELELREKKLALKEKELNLKENDTTQNATSLQKNSSNTLTNSSIPISKVPLPRASNVTPVCDNANAPTGNHPLIDLYCGALGQKPIQIYITGIDVWPMLVFQISTC